MSRQIALDNINLKPTSRWAHTEYSLGYHGDYIRNLTGMADGDPLRGDRFHELVGMDFHWSLSDGLNIDWDRRGRTTSMGHASYAGDGSDVHQPGECPFKTAEEVWAFDAITEYGLPDFDEQVAAYQEYDDKARKNCLGQIMPGGYYRTIVSGAISTFGWEMLLLGAADPDKMEKVFDGFFRWTLFHMEAWAKTTIEVIIQHDDFVWTQGAFMYPEYYRKVIIPRYAELWKPLHAAGKKVIFCSDGTFTECAEDLVAAGADGLCFEPSNDFQFMAERFGDSTCLIGSFVDCRDMAFHTWDVVRDTIDRTLDLANQKCKGLIFAVGNHIPANVPDEMLDNYIKHLMANWDR